MAIITPAHLKIAKGVHSVTYLLLLNGDTGAPYGPNEGAPFNPDKTIHVLGTFGVGGTIVIEGSNDGTNWVTLTDVHANAASYTAEAIDVISESPLYVRPSVTAGDGTTSLTCIIAAHGVRPVR